MMIPMFRTGFKNFFRLYIFFGWLLLLAGSLFLIISNTTTIEVVIGAIAALLSTLIPFAFIREARTGRLNGVVEISDNGVTAKVGTKQYHMDWADVRMAGFVEDGFKSIKSFIFVREYRPLLFKYPRGEKISNGFITVQNRKGLADAVKVYWKGVIVNEDKNRLK